MQSPTQPIIAAIVAMAENRVIGHHNQLPWRLPADLQHFKAITTGHPIIMGRKTYASLGRPLPHRTNIIITRNPQWEAPGCIVVTSIEKALAHAALMPQRELFIIGGADIYKQTLPSIQRIYLTIIHHSFTGDAYFPELPEKLWEQKTAEHHTADAENTYDYSFILLERRTIAA
jgi:dihydrofolate reductase